MPRAKHLLNNCWKRRRRSQQISEFDCLIRATRDAEPLPTKVMRISISNADPSFKSSSSMASDRGLSGINKSRVLNKNVGSCWAFSKTSGQRCFSTNPSTIWIQSAGQQFFIFTLSFLSFPLFRLFCSTTDMFHSSVSFRTECKFYLNYFLNIKI